MPSTKGTPAKEDTTTSDWIKSLEKKPPPKVKVKRFNFAAVGRAIVIAEDARPTSPMTKRRVNIEQTGDALDMLSDEWDKLKQGIEAHRKTQHLHGRLDSKKAILFFEKRNGVVVPIHQPKEEPNAPALPMSIS